MKTLLALTACVALALPTLASAQGGPQPGDILVEGRRSVRNAPSASQPVYHGDLDLRTRYGWEELEYRVRYTARDLCQRLGESDSVSVLAPSCRTQATRDALRRVGTPWARYAPNGTAWIKPEAWDVGYHDPRYDDPYYGRPYYGRPAYPDDHDDNRYDDRGYRGDPYGWGPPGRR